MRKLLSQTTLGVSLAVFALILGVSGCAPKDSVSGSSDQVVVGSLLALSGPDKSFGITQQRGMKIALEEVNAAGGINGKTLKVEFGDTKLTEDLGLQEYKRLTGDVGVQAIVGITGSGVNLRLVPFAEKDKVVLFDSLATSPKLTKEGGTFFFRNIASDAYAGVVLSEWAIERRHKRAALIYNSENSWSTGLKSACEPAYPDSGGAWANEPIAVLNSTDNFNAAIVSIREQNPDAVFVCLMGRQAGLFVAQAKANGLDIPFYGTDPFSQQEFSDNAKDATNQSFFVLPAEEKDKRYLKFESEYKKRYGDGADSIAAKAYDAVHTLAVALRKADKEGELSGEAIRKALAETEYDGITGPNAFDSNGDLREARFDRFTYEGKERVTAPASTKKAA